MVKVTPLIETPAALPRGKGRPVLVKDPRGWFIRSAPRFSSDKKQYWRWWMRQEFAAAARMASSVEPLSYQTAVEMAKGTEFIPRDILMMAIMGNYYTILRKDGTTLENGRVATSNVQYILSLLDPEIGAVIVNTEQGWVALDPGAEGQVLTMQSNVPAWADPTGGGGGGGTPAGFLPMYSNLGSLSRDAASQGMVWTVAVPLELQDVYVLLDTFAGGTYQVGIAPFAAGKITAAPVYTATIVTGAATKTWLKFSFTAKQVLTPDNYMIFVNRSDAGTNGVIVEYTNGNNIWTIGAYSTTSYFLRIVSPTTANTWISDSTHYTISPIFTWPV